MSNELPRLSAVEQVILELLAGHQELYGLEMIAASGGQLKRGTIYVTLNRMEDKGYITSRSVEGAGRGPARQTYRMTGHGARCLALTQMANAMFNAAEEAWA